LDINDVFIKNFSDRKLWDEALGWESSDFSHQAISRMRLTVQELIAQQLGERYFKTHDAFIDAETSLELFSNTVHSRAIYIVRNPLDVAISLANHISQPIDLVISRMNDRHGRFGDSDRGATLQIMQSLGDWSWHVRSWTEQRSMRVLIVRFEDMLEKPNATFTSVADFLDLKCNEEQILDAVGATKFELLQTQEIETGFREKPKDCQRFFNHGRAGRWKEILSSSQAQAITHTHDNMMRRQGYA